MSRELNHYEKLVAERWKVLSAKHCDAMDSFARNTGLAVNLESLHIRDDNTGRRYGAQIPPLKLVIINELGTSYAQVTLEETPHCCAILLCHRWYAAGLEGLLTDIASVIAYRLAYSKLATNVTHKYHQQDIFNYWVKNLSPNVQEFRSMRTNRDIAVLLADSKDVI